MEIKSEDKINQIRSLAAEVLKLSRNTLLVNLRFLDMALSQFEFKEYPGTLCTDGHYFIYDPRYVLRIFRKEKEAVNRDYLHMVLHCIFRHMYVHTLINQPLWNFSCDIAVENIINGLSLSSTRSSRQMKQESYLNQLRKKVKYMTAEVIYAYFLDQNYDDAYAQKYAPLFQADDHLIWYMSDEKKIEITGGGGNRSVSGNSSSSGKDSHGERETSYFSNLRQEEEWKKISERMQTDMETFQKERMQGSESYDLVQNLKEVNREKYDYTFFLKKFAVRGEVMKLDPDEFDYIFYTYGMKMYGNIPLIEPLEYREVKRIREFVIAIDTSGSTSGDLVQAFVQKTYNILKSTESFFSKINVHIIQCDAEITEDAKITSQEEFDQYLKTMKLHGMGGTDFRPVFAYVNQLVAEHEFSNLKGLIYFTDGYGWYPESKPDYETAFVFLNEGIDDVEVPDWAIKLVLRPDELKERNRII